MTNYVVHKTFLQHKYRFQIFAGKARHIIGEISINSFYLPTGGDRGKPVFQKTFYQTGLNGCSVVFLFLLKMLD